MKLLKTITTTVALLSISCVASASTGGDPINVWSAGDTADSIKCQINDVTLLANSETDCTKAGGKMMVEDKK